MDMVYVQRSNNHKLRASTRGCGARTKPSRDRSIEMVLSSLVSAVPVTTLAMKSANSIRTRVLEARKGLAAPRLHMN